MQLSDRKHALLAAPYLLIALSDFAEMIRENLRSAGVLQPHKEDRIFFTSLEP